MTSAAVVAAEAAAAVAAGHAPPLPLLTNSELDEMNRDFDNVESSIQAYHGGGFEEMPPANMTEAALSVAQMHDQEIQRTKLLQRLDLAAKIEEQTRSRAFNELASVREFHELQALRHERAVMQANLAGFKDALKHGNHRLRVLEVGLCTSRSPLT
jgi:hypothetical protein